VAAPAYAGIPVTHRDRASAVAFVTGHEDPDKGESAIDWAALGAFPGTLVMYMGIRRLAEVAQRLIDTGRDAAEPAAVIERGTLPDQRAVTGPLGEIGRLAEDAGLRPPAVTVIGAVAELHERLAWLERRPLHGVSVAVTRARAQAGELAARLFALGARVIEAPAIAIVPRAGPEIDEAARQIGDYALVCITSPNGAELLMDALQRHGRDARALAGVTVAAIGPGTARELARRGVRADIVPNRSIAEALVEALADVPVDGRPVLVARASEARDVLPNALRERGAAVDVVALYDTMAERLSEEQLSAVRDADYITFTSSSTVRFFSEAAAAGLAERGALPEGPPEPLPLRARVVSIGPITSETARTYGMTVAVEAKRHDIDGLVEALLEDAAR
jgi:uroporphyrinogen III methyltransferase/synthase